MVFRVAGDLIIGHIITDHARRGAGPDNRLHILYHPDISLVGISPHYQPPVHGDQGADRQQERPNLLLSVPKGRQRDHPAQHHISGHGNQAQIRQQPGGKKRTEGEQISRQPHGLFRLRHIFIGKAAERHQESRYDVERTGPVQPRPLL